MLSALASILRYPGAHEAGVDSFSIHALAEVISSSGSMRWLVNPLSFVGLAPFSYAPAVPISLAVLSQLSGLSIEATVLAYTLFLGMTIVINSFILGKEVLGKDSLAILLSFLISTAGGIVGFTDWTVSARGTFITLVPLVLAFLARGMLSERRGGRGRWLPLILVMVALIFVHAYWLLLVPLVMTTVILFRISRTVDALLRHSLPSKRRSKVVLACCAATGITLMALIMTGVAWEPNIPEFPSVRSSIIPDSIITRVAIHFGSIIGLGILTAPYGLLKMTTIVETRRRFFLSSLAASFLPATIDPVYGLLLASPLVLLVATLGLAYRDRYSHPKRDGKLPSGRGLGIVALSLAIILAPAVVTIPRASGSGCTQSWDLDMRTYNTALYLRVIDTKESSFVWNDLAVGVRLEAISRRPSLEPILSIGVLAYPWLSDRATIRFAWAPQPLEYLVSNQQLLIAKEWIPHASVNYPYYWGKHTYILVNSNPASPAAKDIIEFYDVAYAVQICSGTTSVFYSGLSSIAYVAYDDSLQRIYLIPR